MKPETAWNGVSLAALAACVGAVAFALYVPAGSQQTSEPHVAPSDAAMSRAKSASEAAQSVIDAKEWTEDSKALSGLVLSNLSSAAQKRKVQVTDLRFDRTLTVGGLKEAPFTVMVEGPLSNVLDFVDSLEGPDSRLGLGMVQVATSDQGPGYVKATLRLTAFLRSEA